MLRFWLDNKDLRQRNCIFILLFFIFNYLYNHYKSSFSHHLKTKHAPNIVYSHSEETVTTSEGSRPIIPGLPYSPYGSPSGSPRLQRQQTRETRSLSISSTDGSGYTVLNQYTLKDEIGKVLLTNSTRNVSSSTCK